MSTKRPPLTVIAPLLPADDVVDAYRMYLDDGKIHFTRNMQPWRMPSSTKQYFIYHTDKRELWRVYAKTKNVLYKVPRWSAPVLNYIRTYNLEPVMPKHMRMDEGL